jgi:hypothetical protein
MTLAMSAASSQDVAQALRTMEAALASARPGDPQQYVPYLRAAIAYWRLKEEGARLSGDAADELEAVAQRITFENQFREVCGRSFHTINDAITYEEVLNLRIE